MIVRRLLIAVGLGVGLLGAGLAAAQSKPDDYALRLPVTVAPGSSLQRLPLPTQALAASRSAGLADVRLFDGAGAAAPMTLVDASGGEARQETTLAALSILGRPGLALTNGMAITVEGGGARVSVQGPAQPAGVQSVLGVLFDTRAVADPAASLALDFDGPAMRLVTFTVESSSDLRDWRQVGVRTMYGGGAAPTSGPIDLGGAKLKDRYLRVTWSADDPATAGAVTVRGGRLTTSRWTASRAATQVRLTKPRPDGDALIFSTPPAAPLQRLRIVPAEGATVVAPIRLLGRIGPEAPWVFIGAYVVRSLVGSDDVNPTIELDGQSFSDLRVEPDKRGTPLGVETQAELTLAPQELLFAASGKPPYTLAVGRAATALSFLAYRDVLPSGLDIAAVPQATAPGVGQAVVLETPQGATGPATRDLVLWAVLVAAALALMGMVAVLWRGRGRGDAQGQG